jgi:hypothetical protein
MLTPAASAAHEPVGSASLPGQRGMALQPTDAGAPAPDQTNRAPNGGSADSGVSPWARIVAQIKAAQPALGAVLDHGMPLEVSAAQLRIGFPEASFFGRQAQSSSAREAILRAAEQVLGARPALTIAAAGDARVGTLAEAEESARRTRTAARREAALSHPRVVDAMEVFEESEGSVDVQVDME